MIVVEMRFFSHPARLPSLLPTCCFLIILAGSTHGQEQHSKTPGATRVRDTSNTRYGDYQCELTDLIHPADVVITADDMIYVTDTGRHRIQIFDAQGKKTAEWGRSGSGSGEFLRPMGIAIGKAGELYVSDNGHHRIQVLSTDGAFKRQWGAYGGGTGQFRFPQGITADRARVYVADTGNDRVQVFDHQGKHLATIGRFGSKPGEFKRPVDVAVDDRGHVYVVDADNHRIQKFDPAGRFVKTWGQWGTFSGLLADPGGIHHHDNHLYVADAHNHRVQVFDLDGRVTYQWGIHAFRPREGAGKLHYPNAVAVAPSGRLAVVCEGFEDRAQVFRAMPPGRSPPPNPFQGMDMTGKC